MDVRSNGELGLQSTAPRRKERDRGGSSTLASRETQDGLGYGTQPGNAAACFTHVAICASSRSSSWMSK